MLNHKDRNDQIHIISMDPLLVEDIYERLREFPGLEEVRLVKPGGNGSAIPADDILDMARDTLASRVLIIDIRSQTRSRLQRAYSDISRFNRPDFNNYCYSVLVGDGPVNAFQPDKGINAFPAYLADLRIDFSPAVFFGDPFLYYSFEEMQQLAVYEHTPFPERISQHFDKYFKEDRPSVGLVRRFFRAADKQGDEKIKARDERLKTLKKLCMRMFQEGFPEDYEQMLEAISREGLAFPGEILRCNVYPFYFEEWVLDVFRKAQAAI